MRRVFLTALQRITERSKRQPGTLLSRRLVQTARSGQVLKKKDKDGERGMPASPVKEPPTKKAKNNAGDCGPTEASTSKWREVVCTGKVKGKGSPAAPTPCAPSLNLPAKRATDKVRKAKGKQAKAGERTAPKLPAKVELLASAWKQCEKIIHRSARETLEKGAAPKAVLVTCPSAARDLQRLAKLRAVKDAPVALVWISNQLQKDLPEANKPAMRQFWVFPLIVSLAQMPKQPMKVTTACDPAGELVAFRVTVAKAVLSKDAWERMKRNPQAMMRKLMVDQVHSSYGEK